MKSEQKIFSCVYRSPIGKMILQSDGGSISGLYFDSSRLIGKASGINSDTYDSLGVFDLARDWLDRYFAEKKPDPSEIPVCLSGSSFCREVWDELKKIPYGKVVTYGEIAKALAAKSASGKMSAQAVGYAVGHNPVSVIVPCHRVIGAGGNLTGYAAGLDKKAALLSLEGVDTDTFFIPKAKIR